MASQSASGTVVVAKITGVHGIKGWVKLYSYTRPRENIERFQHCYRQLPDGSLEALELEQVKQQGKTIIARIRGVEDRDQALAYRQQLICVDAAALPPLAEDDYYWHQLEGLLVKAGSQLLGRVDHLLETGANDVLVVKPCTGSIDQRERLLPFLPGTVVENIDLQAGEMLVAWDPEF